MTGETGTTLEAAAVLGQHTDRRNDIERALLQGTVNAATIVDGLTSPSGAPQYTMVGAPLDSSITTSAETPRRWIMELPLVGTQREAAHELPL